MTRGDSGTDGAEGRVVARVKVGRQGRVVVPAELRERLRIQEGDSFEVREGSDGRLIWSHRPERTRAELVARMRELWAEGGDGTTVEDFIRERRRAAKREAEE